VLNHKFPIFKNINGSGKPVTNLQNSQLCVIATFKLSEKYMLLLLSFQKQIVINNVQQVTIFFIMIYNKLITFLTVIEPMKNINQSLSSKTLIQF
jgi:hypothetical protein